MALSERHGVERRKGRRGFVSMHELSIIDGIVKTLKRIMKERGLRAVKTVNIEVGVLSGVIPRFLLSCWDAATEGTEFESTKLAIEVKGGTLRCEDCLEEFPANINDLRCPLCGSNKLTPLSGMDMQIRDIEAY